MSALSSAQPKVICIIGDVMIDHYINGNCNRISPEAPVQVVEVKNELHTLGGAGNVLKNVFSLGYRADIISVVGHDDNANILIDQLTEFGVSTNGIVKDKSRYTTTKSRVIVSNHQLLRLDHEHTHPIDSEYEDQLVAYFEKNAATYQVVLISDYNKGLLTPQLLSRILTICREQSITTIVDPKGLSFEKYLGANIIKPNKKEASLATGINICDSESLKLACEKLQQITGCDHIIITMSEEGIAIFSHNQLQIIPTQALAIIDVTGAGDTVLASLGIALGEGKSVREACEFANHAAAVVINKIGSATVTMAEINARFNTNQ
jgi:rfaE bifunctional protein kinase chain/domain